MKTILTFTLFFSSLLTYAQNKEEIIKAENSFFGAVKLKLEYDSLNHLTKKTGIGKDENIKPFYHLVAIETYKYDERANLIEIRSYDENEKLISTEFEDTPIVKKVYNKKNQIIEEWYLDENEKPREEYAIAKYSYDTKGNKVFEGWYNEKGEKRTEK